MTVFILTPITEVDNLPDGLYTLHGRFAMKDIREIYGFRNGKWGHKIPSDFTHYLRPIEDVITVTWEEAGKIFEAGEEYCWDSEHDPNPTLPDQQTFIDQLFKEKL